MTSEIFSILILSELVLAIKDKEESLLVDGQTKNLSEIKIIDTNNSDISSFETMNMSSELLTTYNSAECGGNMTTEYITVWQDWVYWCEGIFTYVVGSVGFVGNIFSIAILLTK